LRTASIGDERVDALILDHAIDAIVTALYSKQAWLGHKRIDETMRYVHVAENHPRDLPDCVQLAAQGIGDPDRCVIGARGSCVAATTAQKTKSGSLT
jgi:hypothetical protein